MQDFRKISRSTRIWSLPGVALLAVLALAGLTRCERAESDLPYQLDLKPYYHKTFQDVGGMDSSYLGYSGLQVIDGLPFDIGGEIILYGKSAAERNVDHPDDVSGIKIGRKFDELHLVHAAQWREYYACPVAIVRLHYADGTQSDFQLRCNIQLNDWNRLLTENDEVVADLDTKIIWRGPGAAKGTGRLFKTVLRNPFPDKQVDTVDFISTHSLMSYILIAATVAKADAHRPVTPPRALYPSRNFDGTMNVHVVDKETGAPIAGAEVFTAWVIDDISLVGDPILTGVDGIAAVKFPKAATTDLRVEIGKAGYLTCDDNWSNGWDGDKAPADITYKLTPGRDAILDARRVIGHWKADPANPPSAEVIAKGSLYLSPKLAPPPIPKDADTREKQEKWFREWIKTDAGKKFMELREQGSMLTMKADGTFHGEAVLPGEYNLGGTFSTTGEPEAEVEGRAVAVPKNSGADSSAPFDLGEVVVHAVKHLHVGDAAPEFSVKSLDGHDLKLADYRGKFVLVDFWATWCGPCVAETPNLKTAYDAFGQDPRLVMMSLSLDPNADLPKKFARDHGIAWRQGFLGDWSADTVTKTYHVDGIPAIFLIGPDGKIIATDLRGDAIKAAIAQALGPK